MKKQSAIERLSSHERGVLEEIAKAILCEDEDEEWEIEKLILNLCGLFSYDEEMTNDILESVMCEYYTKLGYDRQEALENFSEILRIFDEFDEGDLSYEECKKALDEFDKLSRPIANVEYYPYPLASSLQLWVGIYTNNETEYEWKIKLNEKIRNVLRFYNSLLRFEWGSPQDEEKAKIEAAFHGFFEEEKYYLVCNIALFGSDNCYYYVADGQDVHIADEVIVPIGKNNREAEGMVVEIKSCTEATAPYPISKMKKIIRKKYE